MARSLLERAENDAERARLLAAMDRRSGLWLQALPISSAGLRLDDSTLHIATGMHLGTPVCAPWSAVHPLVWDATCPDTYAPSYRSQATIEAGRVAAQAETRKGSKYASLLPHHLVQPVAIETSGVFGQSTLAFLKELGKRIASSSGDPRSTAYLLQRLSVAVQRGNAVAVMGSAREHN